MDGADNGYMKSFVGLAIRYPIGPRTSKPCALKRETSTSFGARSGFWRRTERITCRSPTAAFVLTILYRVSPASKSTRSSSRGSAESSASRRTAATLREEIIRQKTERAWLGSEQQLLDRLGVSRPTLRQAARILEAEQLLEVRRGVNGGFFGKRPSPDGVAHMASVVLRSQSASQGDAARTLGAVQMAVAGAATSASAKARESFASTAAEGDHTSIARGFAELSGSPTSVLLTEVLSQLVARPGSDEGVRRYGAELASAVRSGNARAAEKAISSFYGAAERSSGSARIEASAPRVTAAAAAKAVLSRAGAKRTAARKAAAKKAPAKKAAKRRK